MLEDGKLEIYKIITEEEKKHMLSEKLCRDVAGVIMSYKL